MNREKIWKKVVVEEQELAKAWQHILDFLSEKKDIAYVWEIKKKFRGIRKKAKRMEHLVKNLNKLHIRLSIDLKYKKEVEHLENLLEHIKKFEASNDFIRLVDYDIKQIIKDIEEEKRDLAVDKLGRRRFLKETTAGLAAGAVVSSMPSVLFGGSKRFDLIFGSYLDEASANKRLNELGQKMPIRNMGVQKIFLKNELRFRVWQPVGRTLSHVRGLVGDYKQKYGLTDNDIAIVPEVEIYYHIQLSANLNPLYATLFLQELHEEGESKNDELLKKAYVAQEKKEGRVWYKVRLPIRFRTRPTPGQINPIISKYDSVREFNIKDAWGVMPDVMRDATTLQSNYYQFVKQEGRKTAETVKSNAKQQVQRALPKIEQKPITWDKNIKSLVDPAVKFIQRKYKVYSKKNLDKEVAKNYISWIAKYTKIYGLDFLDMLSILVHESRFYEKIGDIKNKIPGTNIPNPSEGFIQMGLTTQITVYNLMLVDKKKKIKKYPLPKAARNIKKEWSALYQYYIRKKLIIREKIPDIRRNPEYQIWFAARFFKFCDGKIGRYNAGKWRNISYEKKVIKEQKELLRFKEKYYENK